MKTIHLIIAVAGLMILSNSCMCGCEEGRLSFNESQRGLIPYHKNEVCSFINSEIKWSDQSMDFTVVEQYNDWHVVDVTEGVMCTTDYMIEEDIATLSDPMGTIRIRLRTIMNWSYTDNWQLKWNNTCRIEVTFWRPRDQDWKEFWIPCDQNGNFVSDGAFTFFHQTMEIGNNIYKDVVERRSGKSVLFYNKTYGILKLVENGKDYLTINR